MCGIVGFAGHAGADLAPAEVLRAIAHRGPDGSGWQRLDVADRELHLGHTRLAILDLSPAGQQPISSRDGRWWITYNGEAYNHLDLRDFIPGPFRGHCDAETLVEGLSAIGIERLLPRLNGMFAFAAVDMQSGRLYLARDPFGVKPLYHARLPGGAFAFGSEVRALEAMAGSKPDVDLQSLQTFLTLRYIPSPKTLWRGTSRVPPGHLLSLDLASGRQELACYIQPTRERFAGSASDALEAYSDELRKAVRRQLLSDVPVGLLLSAGVDSALLAALAKDVGEPLPCFTVGFGEDHPECEVAEAAETARILGLPHSAALVTAENLWQAFESVSAAVEEPLGTTSILPMWHLTRRARQDVRVVLTGQGSDEPWGGYPRYQGEVVRRLLPWSPAWRVLRDTTRFLPGLPERSERAFRSLAERDLPRRFEEAYALFTTEEREALTGRADDGQALEDICAWLDWTGNSKREPVERMMAIDSRMQLADDLLLYGDKISMSVALEARVPFLDTDLVRFVESLPRRLRVGLGSGKITHKRLAERYLPREIVHRRKKNFPMPFGSWARTIWRERIEEILLGSEAPYLDVLSRSGVERLWARHQAGRQDLSRQLFSLLALALWWQRR